MKKPISLLIAVFILLGVFAGCTVESSETTSAPSLRTQAPTTEMPTKSPTENPTDTPTESSTENPTDTPTESSTEIPMETPTEFAMEDLIAGNVKNGDSPEQIEAAFGRPDSENIYQEGATGYDVLEYFYPDGNEFVFIKDLNAEDFTIRSVKIVTSNVATARGLKVGSTQDDVIESFRNDRTDAKILYAAEIREIGKNQKLIIPPRGVISEEHDGEGRTVIAYDVPIDPYNPDEIGEYMYQKHGSIWFVIQDGAVVEYGWFVGAMAE